MSGLSEHHKAWLTDDSGIDADFAESLGWRSAKAGEIGVIVGFNVDSPGIVIPYPNVPGFERVRLDHPHVFPGKTITDIDGKQRKEKDRFARYLSPKNTSNHAYIIPQVAVALKDPSVKIAITEGEKKALAAIQNGLPCIGLAGVWAWMGKSATRLVGEDKVSHTDILRELASAPWMGREVWLFFDSDALINASVLSAGRRLKEELRRRGARARLVVFQEEGGRKVGLDDYFHPIGGENRTLDDLWEYSQAAVVSDAQRDFDIDTILIYLTTPRSIVVRLNWEDGVLIEGLGVADLASWPRFRLAVFNQTSRFPKFKPVKGGSTWDDFIADAVDMVGVEVEAPADASIEGIIWGRIVSYLVNKVTQNGENLARIGTPYVKGKWTLFRPDPLGIWLRQPRFRTDIDQPDLYLLLHRHGAEPKKTRIPDWNKPIDVWRIPTAKLETSQGFEVDDDPETE